MSSCTTQELRGFLEAYGWQYDSIGEKSLVTGWKGEDREYPLSMTVNETMVNFDVNPLIYIDIEWLKWPELSAFLLELNDEIQLVKIAISDEGSVVLSASALTLGFGYEQLTNYLEIIGYYCDVIFGEIIVKMQECGYQFHHKTKFLT